MTSLPMVSFLEDRRVPNPPLDTHYSNTGLSLAISESDAQSVSRGRSLVDDRLLLYHGEQPHVPQSLIHVDLAN